jgi:hypothetical protein
VSAWPDHPQLHQHDRPAAHGDAQIPHLQFRN